MKHSNNCKGLKDNDFCEVGDEQGHPCDCPSLLPKRVSRQPGEREPVWSLMGWLSQGSDAESAAGRIHRTENRKERMHRGRTLET